MTALVSILFFGFFLGMRHATASDHVVAITTMVTRERTIGCAAWTRGELHHHLPAKREYGHRLRPFLIGTIHACAGSAAIALLVLPIIHDPLWAVGYLLIFGLGTIAGMMLITAAIALPVSFSTRFHSLHHHVATAAGLLSVAFGLFLGYEIGFVDGLFTR